MQQTFHTVEVAGFIGCMPHMEVCAASVYGWISFLGVLCHSPLIPIWFVDFQPISVYSVLNGSISDIPILLISLLFSDLPFWFCFREKKYEKENGIGFFQPSSSLIYIFELWKYIFISTNLLKRDISVLSYHDHSSILSDVASHTSATCHTVPACHGAAEMTSPPPSLPDRSSYMRQRHTPRACS